MTDAYLIKDIERPIETVAIVHEVAARARNGPLYVFLEHNEKPNVLRGRRQPLERPEMPEYKRPDTGRSWYHPKTLCFMQGANSSDTQTTLSKTMMALLSERGYDRSRLKYNDGDIFLSNGSVKHIMGTSIYSPEARVLRACWYEEDPISDISGLLQADGIAPSEFAECQELVKGNLFSYLLERHKPKIIRANEFISSYSLAEAVALQDQRGGDVRGCCVTGWRK